MAGEYFSDSELECRCSRCKGKNTAEFMNPLFVKKLDLLRINVDKPVYVSDGYRCVEHNKEVGGVSNSQHLRGRAADIYVGGGKEEYEAFVEDVLKSKLFDGVGEYDAEMFVHVDIRDNGDNPNRYRWKG